MAKGDFGGKRTSNGFQKNPQNINKKGRPKKIYTILKEKGFSKDDIVTSFGELAFYSKKELLASFNDEKKPVIIRIVANQFLKALEKDDWYKIKEILEHTIGKPRQDIKQEIKTDVEISFED